MNNKTILSLFDYSGSWSKPYRDAGYDVIQVDIKHGTDVFEVMEWVLCDRNPNFHCYGILAAPPCTDFSLSGAQYWKSKETKPADYYSDVTCLQFDSSLEMHLFFVYATIEIIAQLNPVFYAIENPVGRIGQLVPELGKPWYFQPYWYGDAYSKKTALFGKFNKPLKTTNIGLFADGSLEMCEVEPEWKISSNGRKYSPMMWNNGGNNSKTKEVRSITPSGFAKSFFLANQ